MKFVIIWLLFIIQKYLILSEDTNINFVCPRNTPLLVLDSGNNECVYEPYNENRHKISNETIKIQWLNKINFLAEVKSLYMTSEISSKGDLIIETLLYDDEKLFKERYYYGIKSNGRPLFFDQINDKFINQISLISTSDIVKFESIMIKIKLTNDDNKDYYLSSCFERYTIDIIDFYNNQVIGISQLELLNYSSWSTKYYSILELKNENKTYMFCFIGKQENTNYISLQKFKFHNANISQLNSYTKIGYSQQNEEFKVYSSYTITCFEISKFNLIQCFYLNISGNYTVGLFKEDSLDYVYSKAIDKTPQNISSYTDPVDIFYRSINLKNEISILAYMINKQPETVFIQLKNIIYNKYNLSYELEDYLIRFKKIEVKIQEVTKFNKYYYLSDLKKINTHKFALISTYDYESEEAFDLYIILFDIYNFHDTNLLIRYYYIQMNLYNLKLFRFLLSTNYNGFLGLIYTIKGNVNELNCNHQKFSIFSYINSTDSELISLNTNTILSLIDYINNENIENNIFGVDLYGIKILKFPSSNETGVYFFSKLENKIIYENDILKPEDEIYFVYDYNILKKGNEKYTIEMAGIVQEKEYSNANVFTIHHQYYGNASPESYYKRKIYIGRTSFYNFTIPNSLNGNNNNSCRDYCKVCYNNICIKCQDNYLLIEDTNICQIQVPNENFYFDEKYNIYKKCNEYCKSCSQGPKYYNDFLDIMDTNCNECIENYYKIENTNNCIFKNNIPENYYFDSNKELICKCFENCKTCNQNKINSTYYSCLSCDENSILYEKSGNCLNCYAKGKYANHFENECIDFIPEGYYLENETNGAISKCYVSCKNCDKGGDSNNHN